MRFKSYKEKHKVLLNAEDKLVLLKDEVFALGDNRKISLDSSEKGPFDFSDIAGIVELDRKNGEKVFDFYYDYIINGRFFTTLFNIF